jgi:hypothetical protein
MKQRKSGAVLLASLTGGVVAACGGAGRNPIDPAPVNRPPEILGIELVGYNVAGHGSSLPIRVEVRDPDGDAVTCRYSPQAGRVLIDGSGNGCIGTYIAPASGLSDRIGITATDSRGASTNSAATLALGPDAVPVSTNPPSPAPPAPSPNPGPNLPAPPAPSATPTVRPTPPAQPTPTPTSSSGGNQPPTVAVAGGGSCHPDPTCTRSFTATATDPEGGSLTYSWSGTGCSGNGASGTVTVTSIGAQTCTVTVRDPLGAAASASGTANGVNNAPQLQSWGGWDPIVCGVTQCSLLPDRLDGLHRFFVADDDTGGWTCSAEATADCRTATCTMTGNNGAIAFVTLHGPGTCFLNLVIRDRWGAASPDYQTYYPLTSTPQ